jgi:hypothetical protein
VPRRRPAPPAKRLYNDSANFLCFPHTPADFGSHILPSHCTTNTITTTMKFIVVAALLASSASAFVSQSSPSAASKSALSVTVGSKFEKEIGVQAPVSNKQQAICRHGLRVIVTTGCCGSGSVRRWPWRRVLSSCFASTLTPKLFFCLFCVRFGIRDWPSLLIRNQMEHNTPQRSRYDNK